MTSEFEASYMRLCEKEQMRWWSLSLIPRSHGERREPTPKKIVLWLVSLYKEEEKEGEEKEEEEEEESKWGAREVT